ncbi:MAG: hypothetical protein AAGG68_25440 [Bacteroidota bacterium]
MNTISTVKNNLHELVVNTQDAEVLQKVEDYFRTLISGKDWWDEMSVSEQRLIQKGTEELEEGLGISHHKVREKVEERLRRK